MLYTSVSRRFPAVSSVRFAGGGSHPGWSIPEANYHKYTYQPTIPDKHYNIGHYNYAPITLWLRARRPTFEHVFTKVQSTVETLYKATIDPVVATWTKMLPGFGLQCIGFLGLLLGYNIFVYYVLEQTNAYFKLEKLNLHNTTQQLWSSGFFASESEDLDARMQDYNMKSMELEQLWDDSLAEATQNRDFDRLTEKLSPSACSHHIDHEITPPISWRFNMMPYGRSNPDAKTFPDNGVDSPSGSLFFWGDVGSTGDYCERVDNKMAMLKKARHFYTGAYIPPTK
jgi:hypothetical protein